MLCAGEALTSPAQRISPCRACARRSTSPACWTTSWRAFCPHDSVPSLTAFHAPWLSASSGRRACRTCPHAGWGEEDSPGWRSSLCPCAHRAGRSVHTVRNEGSGPRSEDVMSSVFPSNEGLGRRMEHLDPFDCSRVKLFQVIPSKFDSSKLDTSAPPDGGRASSIYGSNTTSSVGHLA